jgi:hypothetical protein
MNTKKGLLGLLGIHRNPNCKEFLKCCDESFLRKSSVFTLTDLNPGFDGPWDILWIFLGYGTFILLQKKSFGQKNFIHGVQKLILAIFQFCQNGTFVTVQGFFSDRKKEPRTHAQTSKLK